MKRKEKKKKKNYRVHLSCVSIIIFSLYLFIFFFILFYLFIYDFGGHNKARQRFTMCIALLLCPAGAVCIGRGKIVRDVFSRKEKKKKKEKTERAVNRAVQLPGASPAGHRLLIHKGGEAERRQLVCN